MIAKIIASSFFLLLLTNCSSSKYNGKIENRKLEWTDFKGKPNKDQNYDAYTKWEIYYQYNSPNFIGDKAEIKFTVWRELNQVKSWVRKETESDKSELLLHEQGHYDIAKLCEEELIQRFENNEYHRFNYQYKIDSIFEEVLHKYRQLERKYDFETNHMYNKAAQKKWDAFFRKRIKIILAK